MSKFFKKLLGHNKEQEQQNSENPDLLFGDLSSREREKMWREVTDRATQDQERIIEQAQKAKDR